MVCFIGVSARVVGRVGGDVRAQGGDVVGGRHRQRTVDDLDEDMPGVDRLLGSPLYPPVDVWRRQALPPPDNQPAGATGSTSGRWRVRQSSRVDVAVAEVPGGRWQQRNRDGKELFAILGVGSSASAWWSHRRTPDWRGRVPHHHSMMLLLPMLNARHQCCNAVLTDCTIRLRFDGRSTAYQHRGHNDVTH